MDAASDGGDPEAVAFPRALPDGPFHFSFSGLKTSVVNYINKAQESGDLPPLADVAASVQEAIVDVLVNKTFKASSRTGASAIDSQRKPTSGEWRLPCPILSFAPTMPP